MLRRLCLSVIACLAIVTANAEAFAKSNAAPPAPDLAVSATTTQANLAAANLEDAKNNDALHAPNVIAANELAIINAKAAANPTEAMANVKTNANGINSAGHNVTNAAPRLIS